MSSVDVPLRCIYHSKTQLNSLLLDVRLYTCKAMHSVNSRDRGTLCDFFFD